MKLQFYKDGSSLTLEFSQDDLFVEAVLKYLQKLGLNNVGNLKFFFNSEELSLDSCKTIQEHGMYNNAIIQVTDTGNAPINSEFYDIYFGFNGRRIVVQGQPTDKFCELVEKFTIKAGLKPDDDPKFIFNSIQIPKNDQRTLKQLKLRHQLRVEVFLESEVIGA